jgi:hypothetical protein
VLGFSLRAERLASRLPTGAGAPCATLAAALAAVLQRRGVPEPAASIAADMGIGVFYVGFGHWLDDPADRELVEIVREGFDRLKAVASGR